MPPLLHVTNTHTLNIVCLEVLTKIRYRLFVTDKINNHKKRTNPMSPKVNSAASGTNGARSGVNSVRSSALLKVVLTLDENAHVDLNVTLQEPKKKNNSKHHKAIAFGRYESDMEKQKQKRLKSIQQQLAEHRTAIDKSSDLGRGVFHTPIGKRKRMPKTPLAPARNAIRTGLKYQADIPMFDPNGHIPNREESFVDDPVVSSGMNKRRKFV